MRSVLCLFLGSVLMGGTALAADKTAHKQSQNRANSESMSADMREAIEFQRAKDRADARQAAREAKHPTVFYDSAERSADDSGGKKVPDPGPGVKK